MVMMIWVVAEEQQKKLRTKSIIIIAFSLLIMCWVCSASRPFSPEDVVLVASPLQGQTNQHSNPRKLDSKQSKEAIVEENEACKELSTLGSRPPKCEHKCGGCIPCEAIQVPTTSDHVGVQYTNYMPEGWKCKCGASFFNP